MANNDNIRKLSGMSADELVRLLENGQWGCGHERGRQSLRRERPTDSARDPCGRDSHPGRNRLSAQCAGRPYGSRRRMVSSDGPELARPRVCWRAGIVGIYIPIPRAMRVAASGISATTASSALMKPRI